MKKRNVTKLHVTQSTQTENATGASEGAESVVVI